MISMILNKIYARYSMVKKKYLRKNLYDSKVIYAKVYVIPI